MTIKLAILDLGIGNINSVLNACSYLGQTADIISNKHLVNKYSHIILPGVGSFGSGCSSLTPKLREYILAHIQSGAYIFGICLGMQLLFDSSQESVGQGLGLIPGKIQSLAEINSSIKTPRLGWKTVQFGLEYKGALGRPGQRSRYYFVHSYGFVPSMQDVADLGISDFIAYETSEGIPITACIQYNNILGTQFHPEKSLAFGLDVLNAFICNC